MSTTSTLARPGDAPAEWRVPAVAADLLPPEIVAGRRGRHARNRVIAVLVLLLAGLATWYGVVTLQSVAALGELRAAQRNADRLVQQQEAFSGVLADQAESQAIRGRLATLLAADLQWGDLLPAVRAAAPDGVRVVEVSGELDAEAVATGPAAAADADTGDSPAATSQDGAAARTVGTLTVTGTGTDKGVVADYVDALEQVTGLARPVVDRAAQEDGTVAFSVRMDLTEAVLGGRHAPDANGATR